MAYQLGAKQDHPQDVGRRRTTSAAGPVPAPGAASGPASKPEQVQSTTSQQSQAPESVEHEQMEPSIWSKFNPFNWFRSLWENKEEASADPTPDEKKARKTEAQWKAQEEAAKQAYRRWGRIEGATNQGQQRSESYREGTPARRELDRQLNVNYIAANRRLPLGEVSRNYDVHRKAWVAQNMWREDATDAEIRQHMLSKVDGEDRLRNSDEIVQRNWAQLHGMRQGNGEMSVDTAGHLVMGGRRVAERQEDGSYLLYDRTQMRRSAFLVGNAPTYFPSAALMEARRNDEQNYHDKLSSINAGQMPMFGTPASYLEIHTEEKRVKEALTKERAHVVGLYQERSKGFAKRQATLNDESVRRSKEISESTKDSATKEAELTALGIEIGQQQHAEYMVRQQYVAQAREDVLKGLLSVQEYTSFARDLGYANADEALMQWEEKNELEKHVKDLLTDYMMGVNRGGQFGVNPAIVGKNRLMLRDMFRSAVEVTNYKGQKRVLFGKTAEEIAPGFRARDLSQDQKMASLRMSPEFRRLESDVQAYNEKLDNVLDQFGFDPATVARIKQEALIDAARKLPRGPGEWVGNADNWVENVPLVGGFYAAAILAPVAITVYRLEKGEEVSQDDLELLDYTLTEMSRPNEWLTSTLDMAASSASIAAELYLTGGIATAVRKGTMKLSKEAFEMALKKLADKKKDGWLRKMLTDKLIRKGSRMAAKTVAGVAVVGAQTMTSNFSRVVNRTVVEFATRGVQVTQDDLGVLHAELDASQRPGSVWSAFQGAAQYQFMENISEKLGAVVKAVGGRRTMRKAFGSIAKPVREKLANQALIGAFIQSNPGTSVDTVKKMLSSLQLGNLLEETMEEGGASVLHFMFDGEKFELPKMGDIASLYVSMAIPGLAKKVLAKAKGADGQYGGDSVLARSIRAQLDARDATIAANGQNAGAVPGTYRLDLGGAVRTAAEGGPQGASAIPVQRVGVTQEELEDGLARLRNLPEGRRLVEGLVIVNNRDGLDGKDGRPGEHSYHADDWQDITRAEGYMDDRDGNVVVLLDNVAVREGESAAEAVTRLILHERVGHAGVNAALDGDPKLKLEWERAAGLIPNAELQELSARYPHLKEDSMGLALEWLAHKTGDKLAAGKMEPGTPAARMWQTLRDAVAKYLNAATGGRVWSDAALDAHVSDLIRAARRKVGAGEAAGGGGVQAGAAVPGAEGTGVGASANAKSGAGVDVGAAAIPSAEAVANDPARHVGQTTAPDTDVPSVLDTREKHEERKTKRRVAFSLLEATGQTIQSADGLVTGRYEDSVELVHDATKKVNQLMKMKALGAPGKYQRYVEKEMTVLYERLPVDARRKLGRPPKLEGDVMSEAAAKWLGALNTEVVERVGRDEWAMMRQLHDMGRTNPGPDGVRGWNQDMARYATMQPNELEEARAELERALAGDAEANPHGWDEATLTSRILMIDLVGGTSAGDTSLVVDDADTLDSAFGKVAENGSADKRVARKEQAEKKARRSALSTNEWQVENGKVSGVVTAEALAAHKDHAAALNGDAAAADRLVSELTAGASLQEVATRHPQAKVIALPSRDARGAPDAIGAAYARQIGARAGIAVAEDMTMVPHPLARGNSLLERMAFQPSFTGTVEKGREYVVATSQMDPFLLSQFKQFIEQGGGRLVAVQSLSGGANAQLGITPETKRPLLGRYISYNGINPTLRILNVHGGVVGALSEQEGKELLAYESEEAFLDAALDLAGQRLKEQHGREKGAEWEPTMQEKREAMGMVAWELLSEGDRQVLAKARNSIMEPAKAEGEEVEKFTTKMAAKAEVRNVIMVTGSYTTGDAADAGGREVRFERAYMSGRNIPNQKLPGTRNYETVTVGTDRDHDSEPYLIESLDVELTHQTGGRPELARGTLTLLSDRDICPSCQGLIRMFKERFPNLKIVIRAGDGTSQAQNRLSKKH